MIFTDVETWY